MPGTATVAELFTALEGEFPADPPRGVVLTAVPILTVGLLIDDTDDDDGSGPDALATVPAGGNA